MSAGARGGGSSWFQRFLLPGFAFKAVVIGGGYATGRELAEFFLPGGPWGGLAGMLLAMLVWSVVCALTFVFARAVDGYDYRTFFIGLLGEYIGSIHTKVRNMPLVIENERVNFDRLPEPQRSTSMAGTAASDSAWTARG